MTRLLAVSAAVAANAAFDWHTFKYLRCIIYLPEFMELLGHDHTVSTWEEVRGIGAPMTLGC